MQTDLNTVNNNLSIDVRICGNIPRNEMNGYFGAPDNSTCLTSRRHTLNAGCLAETNGSPTLHKIGICDRREKAPANLTTQRPETMSVHSTGQVLQSVFPHELVTPPWAVAARGESRLEPVCESLGVQSSVDLTRKRSFLLGRSPACDVQLMHATSSRRHALVFHHASGTCYVVDCGSAHGTFVNGKRVPSPSASGTVIPHKVRRGSLIRFGGPGAPCFVLKAFATPTDNMTRELTNETSLVLRLNTRLNALGKVAPDSCVPTLDVLSSGRKRSFDSLSSHGSVDSELEACKRPRCTSPLTIPEQPLRLVSPDPPSLSASKPRRVTFSLDHPQAFYPVITKENVVLEETGQPL